jgi:hypothetical protein
MPIDLAQVDWLYVVVLAVFVLVATFVASVLSFGHRWTAAVVSALLFTTIFVFWTYYPHRIPGPRALKSAVTTTSTPAPAAPAAPPAVPQRPKNPVTDITPPATPPAPSAPAAPATPPAGQAR